MVAELVRAEVDYGGSPALGPIDLHIGDGEIVALVGPSGCGKSTALRLLAGLEAPTRGTARLQTDPGQTAMVFQSATLMPWTTALDNVALPLELMGETRSSARNRARAMLERVKLPVQAADRKPAQLSGGMAMRVSLARALISKPRLLLLDEPFAALDEVTRSALASDVHQIWKDDRPAIVFVTHNVGEAVFMAQRTIVLGAGPGRIVGEVANPDPLPRPHDYAFSGRHGQMTKDVSAILAREMAVKQ